MNGSCVILATDNETGVLGIYRVLFEQAGFCVIDTLDSREALEICQNERIDLVIADIMQPYMNGLEMLQYLRANPMTRHIPVVVVSARADATEIAFQLGADSFIHKPFHPKHLLNEVQRLLAASV